MYVLDKEVLSVQSDIDLNPLKLKLLSTLHILC